VTTANSKVQKQYLPGLALGAILAATVIVLCAAYPLLTVAAVVGLLTVAVAGPARITLLMLVVAIPLFPSFRNFASLATVRCDEFLLVALSAMWLGQALIGRRVVVVGKGIMLLQSAAIVWGLIGFVSLLLVPGTDVSVRSLFVTYRRVQCLLLFFLVIQEVDTLQKAKRLIVLTLLVSSIVSVIGLLQYANIGPVRDIIRSFYAIPGTTQTHPWFVTSTFDSHPNALGAYYVIILSLATAMVASSPREFLNPVWVGVLVLGYATVVATASRASLLALVIGVVVISVMRRVWLLFAMIPPVAVALYFFGGNMTERLAIFYDALVYGKIPTHRSLGQHLRHWSFALERMEGMPFVGHGFGGDRALAINRYLDNYYLYLTYHEGYLSALLFLALLVVTLLTLYRISTECKDALVNASAVGLLAALVGLSAHAIGADTFTWERVAMVLWLCLALVIRADSLVGEEEKVTPLEVGASIRASDRTRAVPPDGERN